MRKSYSPLKSVNDLRAIKGFGSKRLEKMRKYLTVGESTAKKPSPAATAAAHTPAKQAPAPLPRRPNNLSFYLQQLVSSPPLRDPQRHLVGNPNSVPFERHDLLWMIGQHANVF